MPWYKTKVNLDKQKRFMLISKCVKRKLNLITIPAEPKILGEFGLLKLKTCWLYNENFLLQKFNDMYTQVLTFFFSLWHHGGCQRSSPFLRYECYLTTILKTQNLLTLSWKYQKALQSPYCLDYLVLAVYLEIKPMWEHDEICLEKFEKRTLVWPHISDDL